MLEGDLLQEKAIGLRSVLSKLKDAGIESSAVIRRDGIMLESGMPMNEDEKEAFAAMSAAMLGAAETAVSELKQGVPRRVILELGNKKLVAVGAGPVALMVALIGPKADAGKALAEIDRAASEVKGIIKAR